MSPPITLPQEVLILGAVLGNADRVVSTAAEDTVTMGIFLPATTWDEWDGDPTIKGHSSLLSPGKADKPAIPRLVGVENDAPSGWEGREYVLGINGFKGHPIMGLKLYSMDAPITG